MANGARKSDLAANPVGAKPKHALFEPIGLLLLSLATVGTAWCSFQAASWQSVVQRFMSQSATSEHRAVASELKASQLLVLDVMLFSEYINARESSNEKMASFYATRFRGETKDAFNAWMAFKPFENTNAPPHPFVPSLYKPKLLTDAAEAQAESDRLWEQAANAGRAARNYVLITVLLASALFCGGTASRFDSAWIRRTVLTVGLSAFGVAAVRLLALPIQR